MDDPVVITGTGIVTSLGRNLSEVWKAILSGTTGIGPIEGFNASGFSCSLAAQVRDLDARDLEIPSRDGRVMDSHTYQLMKSACDAYREARIDTVSGEDISFFAGMGMVDYRVDDLIPAVLHSRDRAGNLDYNIFFTEGYREIYPLWPLAMLNNVSFCQITIDLDIRSENTVFSPHADSGARAVAEAMHTVRDSPSGVALAGGVSEKVSLPSLARAHLSGVLSTGGRQNLSACRPFSISRNGTILGEGAGLIVLERQSSAERRGVPALAVLMGYGTVSESWSVAGGPTLKAVMVAMEKALADAGLETADIDAVIAHGDGTVSGDGIEIEAIERVFSLSTNRLSIYSSKGAIGHLLAGAPVVDTVLAVAMIRTGVIPPTITSLPMEKGVSALVIHGQPRKVDPKRVLINCQSIEGQAASLIVGAA